MSVVDRHPKLKGIAPDIVCYDKMWLYKDMENMGYLFEYCSLYMKQLFKVDYDIDVEKFIGDFMISDCRAMMELGHPALLSQAAKDTLEDYINTECGGSCEKYRLEGEKPNYFDYQIYWVGWMYAYIHFRTKLPSDEIIEKVPLQKLLRDYYVGHEMSKENYFDRLSTWAFN